MRRQRDRKRCRPETTFERSVESPKCDPVRMMADLCSVATAEVISTRATTHGPHNTAQLFQRCKVIHVDKHESVAVELEHAWVEAQKR